MYHYYQGLIESATIFVLPVQKNDITASATAYYRYSSATPVPSPHEHMGESAADRATISYLQPVSRLFGQADLQDGPRYQEGTHSAGILFEFTFGPFRCPGGPTTLFVQKVARESLCEWSALPPTRSSVVR